jgi:uncharacterized tellurite resistance protein B-like protein
MSLLRFFGLGEGSGSSGGAEAGDSESVRKVAAHLDHLPAESARFFAAFACVLGRVAHADLQIDEVELAAMRDAVRKTTSLDGEELDVVVEIATAQIAEFGGTESYVATREFRRVSTKAERTRLMQCLFAVAAADGTISVEESSELAAIGEELGFARSEVMALRSAWKHVLQELQNLPTGSN